MKKSYEQCRREIAEWIAIEDDVKFQCSKCGCIVSTDWDYDEEDMFNYCPCCGSKMTGEAE